MNERKKILLIGSCGFLLSNFLRKNLFQKDNNYYIGIDKLTESHSFYNKYIHKNYKFYVGDVADIGFLENIFKLERPDIVVFGAGSSNHIVSSQIKLIGLNNLIELDYKYNIDKLIYLGSDKIYQCDVSENLSEGSDIAPIHFEDSIEWACERLLLQYIKKTNILRISNVIGPRQNLNSLTAKTIGHLLSNKCIFLEQQGRKEFDWLGIDNFCSALNLALSMPSNRVYNISSGAVASELEIVYEVCKNLNADMNLIKLQENKATDFLHLYKTSSELFQSEFNWKSNSNWKESIEQMCQWAIANKWYYLRD